MAFTDAQVRQLKAKLDPRYIKTRSSGGVNLPYVEGWHVISEPTASSASTLGIEGPSRPHVLGVDKAGMFTPPPTRRRCG